MPFKKAGTPCFFLPVFPAKTVAEKIFRRTANKTKKNAERKKRNRRRFKKSKKMRRANFGERAKEAKK
ncbi:MAG: hypothetical protein DBX55_10090 [Verrucomicrobia bacterium]|nr:MAG: hypothetical protein DBX55_10090 [Verrucomicrobiota bacterium]